MWQKKNKKTKIYVMILIIKKHKKIIKTISMLKTIHGCENNERK